MTTARLPIGDAVAVAAVDRAAAIVCTLDGQSLPVTDWCDADGVVGADPAIAPFCSAGPDAYGHGWIVDLRRLTARVARLAKVAR